MRPDSSKHREILAWLEAVVNGSEAYGISPQVLASVIRISTHPRIYAQPSTLEEGLAFSKALCEQPNATLVEPGPRHWEIFEDLCRESDATGNLVQDAWFAALAIEWGCEWITLDQDFAVFPGLSWRGPFDSQGGVATSGLWASKR